MIYFGMGYWLTGFDILQASRRGITKKSLPIINLENEIEVVKIMSSNSWRYRWVLHKDIDLLIYI